MIRPSKELMPLGTNLARDGTRAPRRLARVFVCALVLGAVGIVSAGEGRVFRAGAATGDITPELGSMIVGGFSPTPAKYVHDPLLIRALVVDDGSKRLAIVVCDNIGLPREVCDEAKRLTKERSGFAVGDVLIASTHTHSAITAGTETSIGPNNGRNPADLAAYQKLVAMRIADTLHNATQNLEPARIGFGRGREPGQVFNRRWFLNDDALTRNPFGGTDRVRMNPPPGSTALERPAGPTDPDIPFVSLQAADGRPIALFATYSLHYVGGVPSGVVSADYFGVFCTRIGALLHAGRPRDAKAPAFVGLLANGTSGDINNIDFRAKRSAQPPFEQMHRVANAVAAEVYRAYQEIEHVGWVSLDSRYEDLVVAARKPTPEMITRAKEVLAKSAPGPGWHPLEKAYAQRVLQREAAPDKVSAPLQALRLGETLIMTVPVEAFAEFGLELKAQAGFPGAFTVGLANGYYGYLPTPAQHPLGGYETWVGTNRIQPDEGRRMGATLLGFAAAMKSAR